MQIFQHLHHHPVRSRIDCIQLASLRLNRLQAEEHNGYTQAYIVFLRSCAHESLRVSTTLINKLLTKPPMRGQRNTWHQTDHQVDHQDQKELRPQLRLKQNPRLNAVHRECCQQTGQSAADAHRHNVAAAGRRQMPSRIKSNRTE